MIKQDTSAPPNTRSQSRNNKEQLVSQTGRSGCPCLQNVAFSSRHVNLVIFVPPFGGQRGRFWHLERRKVCVCVCSHVRVHVCYGNECRGGRGWQSKSNGLNIKPHSPQLGRHIMKVSKPQTGCGPPQHFLKIRQATYIVATRYNYGISFSWAFLIDKFLLYATLALLAQRHPHLV